MVLNNNKKEKICTKIKFIVIFYVQFNSKYIYFTYTSNHCTHLNRNTDNGKQSLKTFVTLRYSK